MKSISLPIPVILLAMCALLPASPAMASSSDARRRTLDHDWLFLRSDATGLEDPALDDSAWRRVDLPHDWSVEDLPPGPTVLGPFDRSLSDGHDVGHLRGGTGWYRRHFTLADTDAGKAVFVEFDGVQQNADVWINGRHLGFHAHGYVPFLLDLTPHLRPALEANVLVVRAVNPEQNSRWYSGSGLYRRVALHVTDRLHIPVWGPRIETATLDAEKAVVSFEVPVHNARAMAGAALVEVEVVDPAGGAAVHELGRIEVGPNGEGQVAGRVTIAAPRRWSPDTPDLYRAVFRLREDGRVIDELTATFGLRSLEWSAEKGLLLNGETVLLRGGCVHHDNGLLGAAAFPEAEERRVAVLKANGFNAIRTAHNPPSAAFLEACDRLGMLVIDEFVDMWVRPKRPNDYSNHFAAHWERDLAAWVRRDRHHPSVIMWSIGNEVNERAAPLGLGIAANLIDAVRRLDATRPVTNAICGFWDNPGWEWERTAPAFALLDIGGYNYQVEQYESDHAKYPDRIMYGAESVAAKALEYWRPVEEQPHVIGDFIWTAMDYIGEAGIGHFEYFQGEEKERFHMPWPWWVSWCGDIDLIGNKKPQSHYRDVVWRRSPLEVLVHAPIPPGARETVHFWGWPDEEPHWNWTGHEGVPLRVNVYTRAERVRLELNDVVVGEMKSGGGEGITATFEAPYAPGTLTAVALDGDREIARQTLRTTGVPVAIRLRPESNTIAADHSALLFVPIEVVDADGSVNPRAASRLEVKVEGPARLIALGNASPLASGSLQDAVTEAFRGRALAILRSTGETGSVRIIVTSGGLRSATASISAP